MERCPAFPTETISVVALSSSWKTFLGEQVEPPEIVLLGSTDGLVLN